MIPIAPRTEPRLTNLDVFTGDGEPDPEVRPQNDPSNPAT